jgi:hypothetical protein
MTRLTDVTLAELGDRKRSKGNALAVDLSNGHLKLVGPSRFKLDDDFKKGSPWLDTDLERTTHGRDTLWLFRHHIIRYEMLTWACTPSLRSYTYRNATMAYEAFYTLKRAAEEFERMLALGRS